MSPTEAGFAIGAKLRVAFTLLELLVVITLMLSMLSMVAFLPSKARHDGDVQAAAEELQATLRQARGLAMDRRAIFAVSFNVQNASGSTGRVINNHAGQHWYQILGPQNNNWDMASNGAAMCPYPEAWWGNTIGNWQRAMRYAWLGDRHFLPARKVRFLALSDEDDGTTVNAFDWRANWNSFPPTYPRPWFGYWDPLSGRLFPWGGYDPAIVDGNNVHCAAFYYEGRDGTIQGCTNPATRATTATNDPVGVQIYTKGAARPMINGEFEDLCLLFYPDGTVSESFLPARYQSWISGGNANPGQAQGGGAGSGDLGDRWTQYPQYSPYDGSSFISSSPLSNLSGCWYITLAPDSENDGDHFTSANEAWSSIMPAYRIMINAKGMISVIKVKSHAPSGVTFDASISNWQDHSQTQRFYAGNRLTTADGSAVGSPVVDFVTPSLMANRQWWMR